jgi:deazaflavin-dependent oxidoreductase (nitroreductase family)
MLERFLRTIVRPFNKHVFNPLILKVAGSSHSPIGVIRHVGRRSGKPYKTPVVTEPVAEGFVFALPYGPEVDWYRNILAAGRGTVRWHGKQYAIEKPEPMDAQTALPAYPLPLRQILRIMGIQHFLRVKSQAVVPTPETANT